jgi:hypothetical protein
VNPGNPDYSPWSGASNSEKVQDADEKLKEEGKEEDHEVEGAVVPEGLVGRPEPAHEGSGREDDKVDEAEAESGAEVAARKQVEQANDHVGKEQADVRWK